MLRFVLLVSWAAVCLLSSTASAADDKQEVVSSAVEHKIALTASLTNNNTARNSLLSIKYDVAYAKLSNSLAYKQVDNKNDGIIISDYSQWRNLFKYALSDYYYVLYYIKQAEDVLQNFYLEKTDSVGFGTYMLDQKLEMNLSLGARSDKLGGAQLIRPSVKYTGSYGKLIFNIGYSYLYTERAALAGAKVNLKYPLDTNLDLVLKLTSEVYKVADSSSNNYDFNRNQSSIGLSYSFQS